ncbi:MAG TPA: alkaline phosphatase D family protein [Burkholderiales bacterium]|jgi:alkaline phosphatase D|nr:alkaline phosphatase D family protein [Burkholderiales bacterium]
MPCSRRSFLVSAAIFAGAAPLPRLLAQTRFERDPFTLGIASGYPTPEGVVLWTRLAPDPLAGGGMPQAAVEVGWEVATDQAFRTIVRRGKESADAEWAHSVHAEVGGLTPGREYFYRFHAGGATSPVGRTRTGPATDGGDRFRFAFASCQHYEQGYFPAYRHMTQEDLDLVIHLGDYIYESSWGRNHVRKHNAGEPTTLEEYRNRYALYKSDADLKSAHAAFPWIVTWDDHEVQNDYADDRSQFLDPAEAFLERRTAAYRAHYEHMPLPGTMRPRGREMRIYTRAAYGALAALHVLDDRQYRSHQVCPREGRGGSNVVPPETCPDLRDPSRTLLGAAQERWLAEGLAASRARWNVIAQQTIMAQVDRKVGEGQAFWTDGWDGYPRARERLLSTISGQRVANPVVIGGDVHMYAVTDLKLNFDDPASPVVATEFVGGSITSQGPTAKQTEAWRAENPHIHFANGTQRGYTTMELTPRRCTARIRTVSSIADSATGVRTLATWTVEDGKPGAQRGS